MRRSARVIMSLIPFALAATAPAGPAAAAHLQVIHSFTGPDGCDPTGGLVADKKGVLYGTTPFCGQSGAGVVFSLTPPKKGKHNWKFQTLYAFQGGADGAQPFTGLAIDPAGALYGTTQSGLDCNGNGCGTVFKLTRPAGGKGSWKKTTIFEFSDTDGFYAYPGAAPVLDAQGALYVTSGPGPGSPPGFVYKLTAPAGGRGLWNGEVLYDPNAAQGTSNFVGFHPAGVAVDKSGTVYGLSADGFQSDGTAFALSGGTAKVLFPFGGTAGVTPLTSPILDPDGNLYGTTERGGDPAACPNSPGCGVLWKLTPSSDTPFWTQTILHNFDFFTDNSDGQEAISPLLRDSKTGTIYGSTLYGGTGTQCGGGLNGSCGTLFQVDQDGNYSVLWEFPDGGGSSPQGLLAEFRGVVYGTTYDGGAKCPGQHYLGCGTVWKLTP